jgi:hypothetical protein
MKVIIEVREYGKDYQFIAKEGWRVILNEEDCEPVQEGWLTEERFEELHNFFYKNLKFHNKAEMKLIAKDKGWIKPSKTARQELEEWHDAYKSETVYNMVTKATFEELYRLAIKALEEEKK